MREIAEWLARAVSVVEDCGEPEADLLLQQGITSLEDLSECAPEILTALPGIDEDGAARIKARAAELISVKVAEEEEQARVAAENEAQMRAEAEAARAEGGEVVPGSAPPSGPAADREE
jgi:transcription termination factor NusA